MPRPDQEGARKSVRRTAATKASKGFTEEERAAMRERAGEQRAEARAHKSNADGERDVLLKIAAMKEPDRAMAKRIHAIVTDTAPGLAPKTWYGMPAYAREGKVLCFFQSGQKFKTRYATFGFTDSADLDDGNMWPVSFALKGFTAAEEVRLRALLKQAVR
jgi:uncharacterized protein YdhG (YjbR/CyaY superfamily)